MRLHVKCLALGADTILGSGMVTRVLDRLIEERGKSLSVRSDNGRSSLLDVTCPHFPSRLVYEIIT
jgi:hypothetical protein